MSSSLGVLHLSSGTDLVRGGGFGEETKWEDDTSCSSATVERSNVTEAGKMAANKKGLEKVFKHYGKNVLKPILEDGHEDGFENLIRMKLPEEMKSIDRKEIIAAGRKYVDVPPQEVGPPGGGDNRSDAGSSVGNDSPKRQGKRLAAVAAAAAAAASSSAASGSGAAAASDGSATANDGNSDHGVDPALSIGTFSQSLASAAKEAASALGSVATASVQEANPTPIPLPSAAAQTIPDNPTNASKRQRTG